MLRMWRTLSPIEPACTRSVAVWDSKQTLVDQANVNMNMTVHIIYLLSLPIGHIIGLYLLSKISRILGAAASGVKVIASLWNLKSASKALELWSFWTWSQSMRDDITCSSLWGGCGSHYSWLLLQENFFVTSYFRRCHASGWLVGFNLANSPKEFSWHPFFRGSNA